MKRDITFQLDTQGGGMVLQRMTKELIDSTANRVVERANSIAAKCGLDVGYGSIGDVGAPNSRGGLRYYASIYPAYGADADPVGPRGGKRAASVRHSQSWHRQIMSDAARSIKVH